MLNTPRWSPTLNVSVYFVGSAYILTAELSFPSEYFCVSCSFFIVMWYFVSFFPILDWKIACKYKSINKIEISLVYLICNLFKFWFHTSEFTHNYFIMKTWNKHFFRHDFRFDSSFCWSYLSHHKTTELNVYSFVTNSEKIHSLRIFLYHSRAVVMLLLNYVRHCNKPSDVFIAL